MAHVSRRDFFARASAGCLATGLLYRPPTPARLLIDTHLEVWTSTRSSRSATRSSPPEGRRGRTDREPGRADG